VSACRRVGVSACQRGGVRGILLVGAIVLVIVLDR
jgi:hypothetical protein